MSGTPQPETNDKTRAADIRAALKRLEDTVSVARLAGLTVKLHWSTPQEEIIAIDIRRTL